MLRRNTFENQKYVCLARFLYCRRWLWIAAAFFCLLPAIASGVEVTLKWNPSFSPGVVGYNVYHGPDPENYGDPIDAGNATELLISGLEENTTYHFAVTAYTSDDIESVLSKELTYRKIIPSDPGSITGHIRRPSDTDLIPAQDIPVCALDYDLGHWMGCARSQTDGSYAIAGLPSGRYRVRVLSEDTEYTGEYYPDTFDYSAAGQVDVVEGTTTAGIDFDLAMGSVISGRTLDMTGSAIGRLLIYAEEATTQYVYSAATESDGTYAMRGLPAGEYRVRAETLESVFIREYYYNTYDDENATLIPAEIGRTTPDINFILAPGGSITGLVTRKSDDQPIAVIQVIAHDYDSGSWAGQAPTRDDGVFAINGLPAGTYRVSVETVDSDYIVQYYDDASDRSSALPVEVTATQTTADINFRLTKGGKITGKIVAEAADRPLAGLRMDAYDTDTGRLVESANTQSDGSYTIVRLPSGSYRIRVETGDTDYFDAYYGGVNDPDSALPVKVTAAQTTVDINFNLIEGGKISGKVISVSDNQPVAGIWINAHDIDTGFWAGNVLTGTDGSYTITQLPTGSYRVRVEAFDTVYLDAYYGGTDDPDTAVPVEVIVRETTGDIDISLIEGGKITGLVTRDLDNQPLADLQVDAYREETGRWAGSAHTNSDGSFSILRLLTGSYLIRAERSDTHNVYGEYYENAYYDYAATPVDVTVAQTTANIDFELTAPAAPDSDWDRATDVDEVNLYGTDANDADSDDDGIYDGDEVAFWTEKGIVDWSIDLDGDGLAYLLDDDSDADGLTDGYEAAGNSDPADPMSAPDGVIAGIVRDSGGQPLTGLNIDINLYTDDPCHNSQPVETVSANLENGTYFFEDLDPLAGRYYLATENNGAGFLNEWWTADGSSPFCEDADFIDISGGGQGGKDFELDADKFPVAQNDAATTIEDKAVTIHVIGNDTDSDGSIDPVTVAIATDPASGSVAATGDGNVIYTPGVDFNGTVTFSYTVRDNLGAISNAATVSVRVEPVNDRPLATGDDYDLEEGGDLVVTAPGVLHNDTDAEDDSLTLTLVRNTQNGNLTLNPDGSFSYSHDGGQTTGDSFAYQLSDGTADSDMATVTLTVSPLNDPPRALADRISTAMDTAITIAILTNDRDPDGDQLSGVAATQAANGNVLVNPDSTVTYTPDAGYSGPDSFTYRVSDGQVYSNDATVAIVVGSANSEPVGNTDEYGVDEGGTLNAAAPGVLQNDTDPDLPADNLTVQLVRDASYGSLTLDPDGAFVYIHDGRDSTGDSFTYQVFDGIALSNVVAVMITIAPVNDPPVALADAYNMAEDTMLNVAAAGVLANDTDSESGVGKLTAVLVDSAAHGLVTLKTDGSFTYQPDADFSDTDRFSYKVTDGEIDSDSVEVVITVSNLNDAPEVDDIPDQTIDEGDEFQKINLDDFVNDSDHHDDELIWTYTGNEELIVTVDDNRQVTIAVPDADWNGSEIIRFTAGDPGSLTGSIFVTFTVTPVNDPPLVSDDHYAVNEGATLTVAAPGILANDQDPELDVDQLTAIKASDVKHGTLTFNPDGSFTYVHDGSETAGDSFTYQAHDGTDISDPSNPATVHFEINSINDAPEVTQDNFIVEENSASGTTLGIIRADDLDGDSLTYTIAAINRLPFISIDNLTITEGDSGTVQAMFTVTLSEISDREVTVDYATADGTAIAGADYDDLAGIIVFAPGDNTRTITADVHGDVINEAYETFFVNLFNAENAVIADPQGRVIINDDDTDLSAATEGLVAAYSFDEGSGTTVADSSGKENAGTIFGAGWSNDGRFGNALLFDGIDDWVTVNHPTSLELTRGLTLEAWVYPTGSLPDQDWATVIIKEDGQYFLYGNSDENAPSTGTYSEDYVELYGSRSLALNSWTHLAGTYDGGIWRLFINGGGVADEAHAGDIDITTGPLRIGGNTMWGEYFPGLIDEIRIYNRALSAAEIQADMHTTIGLYPPDPPTIVIEDTIINEGDDRSSEVGFTVTLSAVSQQEVTVSYATGEGTAIANLDFLARAGTLTFAPGTTIQTITVEIFGDTIDEGNEAFYLILSDPVNAEIGDPQGQALIVDDYDGAIFTIDDSTGEIDIADNYILDYETTAIYQVIVNVEDSGEPPLSDTAVITIQVTDVNDAPLVTTSPITHVNEDSAYNYLFTASDEDVGDELIFSAPILPGWLSFDPASGMLSGIPRNNNVGDHEVRLRVSDGMVDVDQGFTIKVANTNDAPTIAGSPATRVDENSPYRFSPTAEDVDGDLLTFAIAQKPAWANFDTRTGLISGTPGSAHVGTFAGIVISVTDGSASAFLPAFDLTVVNVQTKLRIQQAIDNRTPAVNDPVVFTITVINDDASEASDVIVTDMLSAGLDYVSDDSGGAYDPDTGNWAIDKITAGADNNSVSLQITTIVRQAGIIVNIAGITDSVPADIDRSDNSSALILNGGAQADLAIDMAVDNPTPNTGEMLTFSLMVSNNGLDDAEGVRVAGALPAGLTYVEDDAGGLYDPAEEAWTIGGIPAGDGIVYHLTATAKSTDELIYTISIMSGQQTDPDLTNNQSSLVINQDVVNHPEIADLAIQNTVNQSSVNAGERILLTVVLRNRGPDDAGHVQVADLLPAGLAFVAAATFNSTYDHETGSWDIGTIDAGSFIALDIIADVTDAGPLSNTAGILQLDQFDPDTANDSDEATIIALGADLAILKAQATPADSTLTLGDAVDFAITITNYGPDDANAIRVTDILPPGLAYQNSNTSTGIFDSGTGVWQLETLAGGAAATLDLTAVIVKTGLILNTAIRHTSTPPDINADNDRSSVTLDVPDDGDFDGMLDEWEAANGLNPRIDDSGDDPDGDDLTNLQELQLQTDPQDSDSDGDSMPDGWEVGSGLNPLEDDAADDADDDGYSNLLEYQYDTHPINGDSKPQPPRADAGPNQTVGEGIEVTLDGSNSSDPDRDILTYVWEQTGEAQVVLSDPGAVQPTFITPEVGPGGESFTFRLTVVDALDHQDTAGCVVNVTWDNNHPEADAGPDQGAGSGTVVALDGSNSSDPDDGIKEYIWEQLEGETVQLSDSTAANPDFEAPTLDTPGGMLLKFLLRVIDHHGLQDTDTCIVNVTRENEPPFADAGPDQEVSEGDTVILDGSGSRDDDDGIQHYFWRQTAGIPVTLSDAAVIEPTFVTPAVEPGNVVQLEFLLEAIDKGGLGDTDIVRIDVADNGIIGFGSGVLTVITTTMKNIGIAEENGGNLVGFTVMEPDELDDKRGMPDNLIYGLFDIKIKTHEIGGKVRLKVHFENPAPPNYRWYKFSPKHGWYDYGAHVKFSDDREQVILTLIDGGAGDDDNLANGIIIDPSGLGKSSATINPGAGGDSGGGGGGGGCFIDSAVDGGSLFGLLVLPGVFCLPGLLGLLGLLAFMGKYGKKPGSKYGGSRSAVSRRSTINSLKSISRPI